MCIAAVCVDLQTLRQRARKHTSANTAHPHRHTGVVLSGCHSVGVSRLLCILPQASLSEMIPPGCLVMLTPVVVGVLFGTRTLAGVLAGALVSGVQMAVSMSNTGSAWDNAKKYVEVWTAVFAHTSCLLGGC